MNFLKILGMGMYYRIRRIKKALRNWRKFGVIIFGSLFLAGSLFGVQMADAQGSFHVSLSPTNSAITLGQSKLYTAQAFNGITNVTSATTFAWTASKAGQTVAQSAGTTWNFTPAEIGVYTMNVRGTHSGGDIAFADTLGTLTVTTPPTPPTPEIHLTVSLYPTATNPILLGQFKLYTAQAFNGTTSVTFSSIFAWTASKGGQTVAQSNGTTWNFTPSTTGTYTINTRGTYSGVMAFADTPATLVVQSTPPPVEYCSFVNIIDSSIDMTIGESQYIAYSAKTNLGNDVSYNNLVWSITGGSFSSPNAIYTATQAGNFVIRLSCRANPSVTDSANIAVSGGIIIDEFIVRTDISANRNSIYIYEQTNLATQAWSNLGRAIPDATYYWQKLSGVGYLAGDIYSRYGARFVADSQTGSALIQVRATWRGVSVTNTMTIFVSNYYVPPVPVPPQYYIDGYITAAAQDNKPICEDSVIVYTVQLTNRYNTVNNTTLTMTLPQALTILSASSYSNHPYFSGQTVTWTPGTLTTGQSVVLTVTAFVKEGVKSGTNLGVSALVKASEILPSGFHLYSNSLKVYCAGAGGPISPLPPTGSEAIILSVLAVVSLGLAFLTYRWLNRRMSQQIN